MTSSRGARERLYVDLTKRALRTTAIGAMTLNTLILVWTWGSWHRFAIALGLYAVIFPLNLLLDRLVPKYGTQVEIGRALMNQSICAIAYQWIGWPLPVWLWMPFMPLAFNSMESRQSLIALAISCGVQDAAAIVGGVSPEIPIVFTTLSVMAWVLINARVQIIREMLVTADNRGDDLERAHTRLEAEIATRDGLATLVTERSNALEARTRQMRLVFDQVDQGILVVDVDGTIAADHSAIVETWLGPIPDSQHIADLVRVFAPSRAAWFSVAWSALGDDVLPLELAVTQLPQRFEANGRQLQWSYKPFEATPGSPRILVVISDLTEQLVRAQDERHEREATSLLSRAIRDQAGFVECFEETARLVAAITSSRADYRHALHTLKGVAGLLELTTIAEMCHALETALAETEIAQIDELRTAIDKRWQELAAFAAPFVERARARLDVTVNDVIELETKLDRGASSAELRHTTARWRDERASGHLERVADFARSLATRLGVAIDVVVDCDTELRARTRWAPIWAALSHAVSNALDHGIESRELREASGKPAVARLVLRAGARNGALVVEISDDGRGIDWERVAELAVARGLPASTQLEREAALFTDGLSTSEQVSETSGRGVGLGALRETAVTLGARLSVTSSPSRGTTIGISLPLVENEAMFASRSSRATTQPLG